MRRLTLPLLTAFLAVFAISGAALGQIDLSVGTALTCGGPSSAGQTGVTNLALIGGSGLLCNATQDPGGHASVYTITLAQPTLITVSVLGNPMQISVLGAPYGQDDCAAASTTLVNPTVNTCLAAGTYGILVSTPVRAVLAYEVSVTCEPCTPVSNQAQVWGNLKGSYR